MKTIVISGAHSNVGKSMLAASICGIIPGAVHVKLGHGRRKEGLGNAFYPVGTPYAEIAAEQAHASMLVIESNRILGEIVPDCAIYLTGGEPKPSAKNAADRADITRGKVVDENGLMRIGKRLGLPVETVAKIALSAGAGLPSKYLSAGGGPEYNMDERDGIGEGKGNDGERNDHI